MLSRGLRISFVVGIILVVLAVGLHTGLRLYNAPESVEFSLLNTFGATFASIILTFIAGALVADYQIEDNARKNERLDRLLDAELAQAIEDLEGSTPVVILLPDGSSAEVKVSQVEPIILEEAVRLLGRSRSHNARILYLMSSSAVSGGAPDNVGSIRRMADETEASRREIIEGLRSLLRRHE